MADSKKQFYLLAVIPLALAGILVGKSLLPRGSHSRLAQQDAEVPRSAIDQPLPDGPQAETPTPFRKRMDWGNVDDPSSDGWETEAFARRAQSRLNKLRDALIDAELPIADVMTDMAAADFRFSTIHTSAVSTTFHDAVLRIARSEGRNPVNAGDAAACIKMLKSLVEPITEPDSSHVKFKIIRVMPREDGIGTRQLFSLSGRTATGMLEVHATWDIDWKQGPGEPHMRQIEMFDIETVESFQKNGPLFSDCTASVLASNAAWRDQILIGYGDWLRSTEEEVNLSYLGTPGIALGDVNGDGLDDLYLCQGRGLPNRLFIQNPDGTATDASSASGVDWLEHSRAALLVDLDNDGDQDLALAVVGGIIFASNDGGGIFSIEEIAAGGMDATSLSASDVDADGDLDVYQCVYHRSDVFSGTDEIIASTSANFVYHDANNAGRNQLLRNDGDWAFTDITEASGLDTFNRRFSYAALFTDYDDDGDPDLYVANDFGRDSLYLNEGMTGTVVKFTYVSDTAGADPGASGMGLTGGDFDRDGDQDIYVANMFSSAGGRIAFQQQFRADATPNIRARIQRFARGNTLLQNQGNGTFEDISEAAAVTIGRWAWGTQFADINNDGWQDLAVANGFISNKDTGDL